MPLVRAVRRGLAWAAVGAPHTVLVCLRAGVCHVQVCLTNVLVVLLCARCAGFLVKEPFCVHLLLCVHPEWRSP